MSALFLPKKTLPKQNISDKMMNVLQRAYNPLIEFAMRQRAVVIIIALIFFTGIGAIPNTRDPTSSFR